MADSTKIPGYKVSIIDQGSGKPLTEKKFLDGPGSDDTFIDHVYGPQSWDRIRIRQKTFEGDVFVTFRNQSAGNTNPQYHSAAPDKDVDLKTKGGQAFRVQVETLPETEWKVGDAIKFSPPRARIEGRQDGWLVTFEPQQYPCVATVAVADKGTKDENLPSFPFPSTPKRAKGSFLIPRGKFGARDGGVVRLGVRGAGLSVAVKLPPAGESTDVDPKTFKLTGAAQTQFLEEQYVAGKFNEKKNLIQYG